MDLAKFQRPARPRRAEPAARRNTLLATLVAPSFQGAFAGGCVLFTEAAFVREKPDKRALQERLRDGNGSALKKEEFFKQLLRLVYRLIFVMTAEDREIIFGPDASEASKATYFNGYSLARLRDRSRLRSAWDRHYDAFEGVKVAFDTLGRGETRLGLPALGGLFDPAQTPDILTARIANKRFLSELFHLGWLRESTGLVRINWRDMETEEFGSVYESLLELTPELKDGATKFYFVNGTGDEHSSGAGAVSGNQRKTTMQRLTHV